MKHLYNYAKWHPLMPGNKDVKKALHVLFAFLVPLFIFSACMEDDFDGELSDVCPNVESYSPDTQGPVLINSIITASFNKEMKPESINDNTFIVSYAGGRIQGNLSYDDKTVRFVPSGYLPQLTEVTVEITTEVYDFYDFTIPAPHRWSFTTGRIEDITSPYIVATVPENNAVDVPLTTLVSATFNEDLDPASVTQQSLKLFDVDNDQEVPGNVSYANMVVTFTPAQPLAYDTSYEAVVAAGISDTMGNLLEQDYMWAFKTEEEEEDDDDDDEDIIPIPIDISEIAGYAILAGTYIWNDSLAGPSHITGDVGMFPGVLRDVTDIDFDTDVDGDYYIEGDTPIPGLRKKLIRDKLILFRAYNDAIDADDPEPQFLSGDQGGVTLPPGIYSAKNLRIHNGDLVLDAGGKPHAFWIFQVESLLETSRNIILEGEANPENIFWQVGFREILGPNVLIGADTEFVGTVLSKQGISVGLDATVTGRLMVKDGGVRLNSSTIALP